VQARPQRPDRAVLRRSSAARMPLHGLAGLRPNHWLHARPLLSAPLPVAMQPVGSIAPPACRSRGLRTAAALAPAYRRRAVHQMLSRPLIRIGTLHRRH
ncbi:MAG: hypothetical protein WBB34_19325, partial [Xanthobacteraceae bacterium]